MLPGIRSVFILAIAAGVSWGCGGERVTTSQAGSVCCLSFWGLCNRAMHVTGVGSFRFREIRSRAEMLKSLRLRWAATPSLALDGFLGSWGCGYETNAG